MVFYHKTLGLRLLSEDQFAMAFDELGAARTLSQMIVDGILQRERAARMVQFSARIAVGYSFNDAIGDLVKGTWYAAVPASGKLAAIQRTTHRAVSDRLILLAADKDASPEVRGIALLWVDRLRTLAVAKAVAATSDEAIAHWRSIANDLKRYQDKGELPVLTPALRAPPGDPFGEEPDTRHD